MPFNLSIRSRQIACLISQKTDWVFILHFQSNTRRGHSCPRNSPLLKKRWLLLPGIWSPHIQLISIAHTPTVSREQRITVWLLNIEDSILGMCSMLSNENKYAKSFLKLKRITWFSSEKILSYSISISNNVLLNSNFLWQLTKIKKFQWFSQPDTPT